MNASQTVAITRVSEFAVSESGNRVAFSYDGLNATGEAVALTVFLTPEQAKTLGDALVFRGLHPNTFNN